MTPLNSSKGVALVVLIIAMTLISVLATSLVSIVADKNKSMIYTYDGFHASVIADSGAAFAIRYISEGLCDTSKPYFYDDLKNRAGSIDWKYYSSVYKLAGVTDPIGKFKVTWSFSNDNVVVESDYNHSMATRKVKISNFRSFLSPITFYPDYATRPVRQGAQINVRMIGNHDSNLSVSRIDLMAPVAAPTDVYLKQLWAPQYSSSSAIWSFDSDAVRDAYALDKCENDPTAPCLDATKGLKLRKGEYTQLKGITTHTIFRHSSNYYQFVFDSVPFIGQYVLKITSSSGASIWYPELRFTPRVGS